MKGKKIIVGVTGSIAAYKAAVLVRLLVKEGAEVQVLMTPLAKQFITPLTMATLSHRPILVEFFNPENGSWNSHVDLGLWADLFLIAPATANTIAKMAAGQADNLLLATYLSARCPVWIAPAMDHDMFSHPATAKNMDILKGYGNRILDPVTGDLASGLSGKGRMEEPDQMVREIVSFFSSKKKLQARKILITAGPTYEAIDPVRFIGNHSSGKMGFALARQAQAMGAEVTLVIGPVALSFDFSGMEVRHVKTAAEMYQETVAAFKKADAAILSAAVSDYAPADPLRHKMKRGEGPITLELQPTTDIAAQLGKMKKPFQRLVGFALETDHALENARKKMQVKNLDMIVLNSLHDPGAGFSYDTNKITILGPGNKIEEFGLKPKEDAAYDILDRLADLLPKKER